MKSKEIRNKWLNFFESKGHLIIPSKSLIPIKDDSLLWINSGVATLKDFFSGKKIPPSKRLTNSQKSIRTNDIENVGKTARHHTFFEMLGNFSIGDYFKKEAINFGFEFIFDVLKFDREKIFFTYFSEDLETLEILKSLNVPDSQIIKGSRKTNFWDMGNGPCGPNLEIFYDRGPKYSNRGIELLKNDIENDRYIEIWNIVFSQFNNDGNGNYELLKQKNIDTGAGLERLACILQDTPTNFETDLFLPIIKEIEKLSIYKYKIDNYFLKDKIQEKINLNFKIISDHLRTAVNAINDGAKPSNNGRGYIIRRLIRRAYRSGIFLGIKGKSFLHKMTQIVRDSLIYDIDVEKVSKIIKKEEEMFSKTISEGINLLKEKIKSKFPKDNSIDIENKSQVAKYFKENNLTFDFSIAFELFSTFGFPVEIIKEILEDEYEIELDISNLPKYLEEHANKSRSENSSAMQKVINSLELVKEKVSEFVGYSTLKTKSKILYLLNETEEIHFTNSENEISYLILDKTPFYATAGGQRHDKGLLIQDKNRIEVLEVFKDKHLNNVHKVKGKILKSELINAEVDSNIRIGLERNHSGTHLVFNALSREFGKEIEQLGSDNNEERLTFDFPLSKKPSWEEIKNVEKRVNEYINMSVDREYIITTLEGAKKLNAVMTLEEQEYMDPNEVRIVNFPKITADLCGGTHIENTKKIETFKIISLDSKGKNKFRIKAITSKKIVEEYLKDEISKNKLVLENLIEKNKSLFQGYKMNFSWSKNLDEQNEQITKHIDQARSDYKKLLKNSENKLEKLESDFSIMKFKNTEIIFDMNLKMASLQSLVATLREKNPKAIVILGSEISKGKFFICVGSKEFSAKDISNIIFEKYKGKGGGNNILSQGSIDKKIEKAEDLFELLKEKGII
ncbi:alanine--tRNA ligase [[Mycoplasma] mobile]|uniref:Alanine--tRNA ligase n=1 Tax=Mycoplasma mobile (strain ATCC 43663 / 163K / NCTC 11711) TaxID=267748 RepID=SYA_MYCM1|nr:alanine--tRNA ligase [[Mycoplasma] mobile]Q6KHK5.1 RecName: Full=Alanine--tRNA ligase; AltName: Full=Alanyl-tRNA synthetase; Short=AlaRS [Mycoplasma mobile 163K]AAT27925.1 alanyl-tRNA synthetase [Mycoplasma mobile 163K]